MIFPNKQKKASHIIENGAESYPEIIAEVVYVLVKLYSVPREKIYEIVSPIAGEVYTKRNPQALPVVR